MAITNQDIIEAKVFAEKHGEPFNHDMWDYIIRECEGFFPVTIRAIPEGTPTKSLTPIVTIESKDPIAFSLVSYLETSLQRGVWYPTTIASNDRKNYQLFKEYYDKFSDTPSMIPFSLHDFGGRGGSSEETIQVGGAAHLVYFQGSDSISGVRAANHYYNCDMSAYSVPATEHSVQCAYGQEYQREYLNKVLDTYAKSGKIVSIVIDGYDVYREAALLCSEFKDKIVSSGAKVVFRPDSGNALDIIPRILLMQEEAFGFTKNSKGMKVINNVGIIQGDGVNHDAISEILKHITNLGYAPESVIFGSGGALLQKVDRDAYKFAQKTSRILINGVWKDVYKDPVTDPGKRSKAGDMNTENMVTVYENGKLLIDETLETIRSRAIKEIEFEF